MTTTMMIRTATTRATITPATTAPLLSGGGTGVGSGITRSTGEPGEEAPYVVVIRYVCVLNNLRIFRLCCTVCNAWRIWRTQGLNYDIWAPPFPLVLTASFDNWCKWCLNCNTLEKLTPPHSLIFSNRLPSS